MGMLISSRARIIAPLFFVMLAACSQQVPSDKATQPVQATATSAPAADPCTAHAQVAVDFVNLYVKHLKGNEASATPTDTYEWLKASSLVDSGVASAYAAADMVDADPIINAQDYPDTFALANCQEAPSLVLVKGVGEPEVTVPVRVASTAGGLKVVGVGTLNMPADADGAGSPASPATVATTAAGTQVSKTANDGSMTLGSSAECVENKHGAPSFGSPQQNGGFFLCREPVEIYWNDWYGSRKARSADVLNIVGEGKTAMFEGELAVDCAAGTARWVKASTGWESSASKAEIRETVPAKAVANAQRYICG